MGDLIDSAVRDSLDEVSIDGVLVAEVVANLDMSGLGRVQLRLPGFPEYQPWARVATFAAGSDSGAYFIPQIGDEVLVAFHHGDVREPFVIGSLWNGSDRPPRSGLTDPTSIRVIRTPAGHEIELDDFGQSISITSSTDQTFIIDPDKIEITAGGGAAKIKLTTAGEISIEATTISLQAQASAEVKATELNLSADASATLKGSGQCTIQGGLVKIN